MNSTKDGGYDNGYRQCPCFWGQAPGSLVLLLEKLQTSWSGAQVLDLGCGEGKNAAHFCSLGATVTAVDLSPFAISNGKSCWGGLSGIKWINADALEVTFPDEAFDVVLLYGLPHCLSNRSKVAQLIANAQRWTKINGHVALVTFNLRHQELEAHPGFEPHLEAHNFYTDQFGGWGLLHSSDLNLVETHPHNDIRHTHSVTRILARKVIP